MYASFEKYVDERKHYEEEMKKTYVLEQRKLYLEDEVKTLKDIARHVVKVKKKGVKTYDYATNVGDIVGQPMVTNEEELESSKEIEIRKMHNLLIHKIGSLKHSS